LEEELPDMTLKDLTLPRGTLDLSSDKKKKKQGKQRSGIWVPFKTEASTGERTALQNKFGRKSQVRLQVGAKDISTEFRGLENRNELPADRIGNSLLSQTAKKGVHSIGRNYSGARPSPPEKGGLHKKKN